jgi:6-phosphogluconolactonase
MSKLPTICVFDTHEQLANETVGIWADIALRSVMRKEAFYVALSGGRTPTTFLHRLTTYPLPLPWDQTHIFFVDERYVPHEDTRSNYRVIYDHLIQRIPISSKHVHPVPTHLSSPVEAARRYEYNLRDVFGVPKPEIPAFDLIILGLGADGHTASLFPGSTALTERTHLAVPVTAGRSPAQRITLTLPVLNSAENVIVLAQGSDKAHIVKLLLQDKHCILPAAKVKPSNGNLLYLFDQAAASLRGSPSPVTN